MKARPYILGLTLVACGIIPQVETTQYHDEGDACLLARDEAPREFAQRIEAGEPVDVMVFFPSGCLSSSCSEVVEATCTATVSGSRIVVTSSGILERDVSKNRACTDDCGFMTARCAVPVTLDEGEWILVHGDLEQALTIPGDPACSIP